MGTKLTVVVTVTVISHNAIQILPLLLSHSHSTLLRAYVSCAHVCARLCWCVFKGHAFNHSCQSVNTHDHSAWHVRTHVCTACVCMSRTQLASAVTSCGHHSNRIYISSSSSHSLYSDTVLLCGSGGQSVFIQSIGNTSCFQNVKKNYFNSSQSSCYCACISLRMCLARRAETHNQHVGACRHWRTSCTRFHWMNIKTARWRYET